jgi:class 3 adenylate cyclase
LVGRGRELVNRFVLGVDVEKYSARNVRQQDDTQRALDRILHEAATAAGLDRQEWVTMPGGDGEHAILPADVDMVAVASGLVAQLDDLLTAYNEDHSDVMKIRLRVAMHMDMVLHSALGYAGPGLVVLSRLLDAAEFKQGLARARDASLALLVSEPVYRSVIESGLGGLRPGRFRLVQIDNPAKGFRQGAYLYIPGSTGKEPWEPGTAGSGRDPSPPGAGDDSKAAGGTVYNTTVTAPVISGDLNASGRDLYVAGRDVNIRGQAPAGD